MSSATEESRRRSNALSASGGPLPGRVRDFEEIRDRSSARSGRLLGQRDQRAGMVQPMEPRFSTGSLPSPNWFCGGTLQHRAQLSGPPSQDVATQQARPHLGERKGKNRTFSYFALHRGVVHALPMFSEPWGEKKGRRHRLRTAHPEQLMAILAIARLSAIHSVVFEVFRGRFARPPHSRCRVTGRHHRRWWDDEQQIVPPQRRWLIRPCVTPAWNRCWWCAALLTPIPVTRSRWNGAATIGITG